MQPQPPCDEGLSRLTDPARLSVSRLDRKETKMEQKTSTIQITAESVISVMKYVLSFFMVMLMTYVICIVNEGSAAFSFAAALSAGILALLVCQALFEDHAPGGRHYYIWMAALLSFCAVAVCYTGLGVYPFGEKSVMIIDMHHQYSSFFSLIREKIWSFDSLSYSESVGMGGGLIPLIAYYLCSPYNIIALLLPREYLTEAIALIEVLKMTSAGATFAIFCKGVFKKEDYGSVAASVAYALSAYFIAYSWDVMWLDCLVLLPLIVYGLEKVMEGRSPLLYCVTLGLAVTTNYYIGYMVCVFMVLWFLMRTVERDDFYRGQTTGEKAVTRLKKLLRFAWTSAVGGMLSMWILIPTAISLRETSGAEDQFAREVKENFDFWDIFSRTLYGSSPTERGDNLPNIYCSLLAVFLIVLFLVCRRIRLRTRVCFGGLLAVLVLLMANNWTNFAFHGFHFPNDLPYRNSFLVSFVMLTIAVQTLDQIKRMRREDTVLAFAVAVGLLVIEQKIGDHGEYGIIWSSLGFLAGYAVLLTLAAPDGAGRQGNRVKQRALSAVLLALLFAEVASNAVVMIRQLNENEVFTDRMSFASDYDINKATVSRVESFNTDGSRMEFLPRKTCNDDALYDYAGLTVFASSNAKATTTLMGKLGYAINGVNSYMYHSFVPLADSMLNLKYVAFNHDIGTHAQLSYVDSVSDSDGGRRFIYENTLALSRGFVVHPDIVYWNSNHTSRYENPFEVQNKLVEYAVNGSPVYSLLPLEVESQDGMSAEVNESYFYTELEGRSGSFTALHVKEREAQSYVYVDCRAASAITVSVNDSSWSVTPYEPYIIDLGKLGVGTEVRVTVDADTTCSGNIYLAEMDTDALYAAIQAMKQNQWQITEHTDGYFKGTVNAPEGGVLFTSIPYNDGWRIRVDGKTADVVTVGDALIGIRLSKGSHEVEMKYSTSGFPLGVILTLLGVAALVLWVLRRRVVYPLLKECVPVLYPLISEAAGPTGTEETGASVLPDKPTSPADRPVPATAPSDVRETPVPPDREATARAGQLFRPDAQQKEETAVATPSAEAARSRENADSVPRRTPAPSAADAQRVPVRQVSRPAPPPVSVPDGAPEVFEITEDNRTEKK